MFQENFGLCALGPVIFRLASLWDFHGGCGYAHIEAELLVDSSVVADVLNTPCIQC